MLLSKRNGRPGKMAAVTRRHKPNDPDRPERIARAAIAVVAKHGVERVTHRLVAAEAGVPLGSTTYHYATLDDLLAAAVRIAGQDSTDRVRAWDATLPADADLASELADQARYVLTEDREQAVVDYALYVAAMHRPQMRAASLGWDKALEEIFSARCDPLTGRLLALAYNGMILQSLLLDMPPRREDLVTLFRRAIG